MKGLLIHAGAVGDFVMSLRVVEAVRQVGATFVTVLGRPEIASVAVGTGGVDAVLDLNGAGYHTLFAPDAPISAAVREGLRDIDLALDMLGGPAGSVGKRLSELGIPRVVSIDPRPRPDWHEHVTDQWLSDLAAAGITAAPGPPRIRIPDARRTQARITAMGSPSPSSRPFVIIHPGSGGKAKCWPVGEYLSLAHWFDLNGWQPVFLLGPVEAERFSADDVASLRAAAPLVSDRSLPDAAALLASANLYVGNDSGMSHLAAAVGAPTIVLFGPTAPRLWRPLGENVHILIAAPTGGWPSLDTVLDVANKIKRAT